MLVVVSGLESAVNAFPHQKRQQDDLLTSTDPPISSQEVVLPSSFTDSDTSQADVPPFLTVIASQNDSVPSLTDQSVFVDHLLGNNDDCKDGKDCEDQKKTEYLIEYENQNDKEGYYYRYV